MPDCHNTDWQYRSSLCRLCYNDYCFSSAISSCSSYSVMHMQGLGTRLPLTWSVQRRRTCLSLLHTRVLCRQSSANAAATPQVQPSSAILGLQVSSLSNFDLLTVVNSSPVYIRTPPHPPPPFPRKIPRSSNIPLSKTSPVTHVLPTTFQEIIACPHWNRGVNVCLDFKVGVWTCSVGVWTSWNDGIHSWNLGLKKLLLLYTKKNTII